MRKIFLFMMVSLDGYFEGVDHDITWHTVDDDFNTFAIEQTRKVGTLLFGRRTYKLMESYWPTEAALKDDPQVAALMNNTPKIVFSKALQTITETKHWKNVTLLRDNLTEEIKKLKEQKGKDIAIYGSNNLATQLMEHGLLDEVRVMIAPIVLGAGTPLFQGIKRKIDLKLLGSRKFNNGNVLLTYNSS